MPQLRKEQLNVLNANWSTYTYSATAGDTFTDLPAGFEAATVTQVSGGETSTPTRGIVTVAPSNYVKIKLEADRSSLSDSGNIFGRLTYSAGIYTITYYKLSGGSEVSATLPGSGTYDLLMMFPEVMNFDEIPFDSLITLGENSTGGSANIIIPDGGELSGTYEADVFCQGNATVVDNLVVNGDLVVVGNLINDSGYNVEVVGKLKAVDLIFSPASPTQIQGNLTVGSDLIVDNIYYPQTPGSNSILEVKGNAILAGDILGNGELDSNGLTIIVRGNVLAGNIEIYGGAASLNDAAGNGGSFTAYSNVRASIIAYGGDADDSISMTGLKTAGYGGSIDIYHDFIGSVVLDGGDAVEAAAGDGGTCNIYGHAIIDYFDSTGGLCHSSNENHRSGYGGSLSVYGGLTSQGVIDLSGGNRTGVLTANGAESPPDGGNLLVVGNCTVDIIGITGGTITTTGGYPSGAGAGGYVEVRGDLYIDTGINGNGGSANYAFAGDGGEIYVKGNLDNSGSIEIRGGWGGYGIGFDANAGNGGLLTIDKSLSVNSGIECQGGSSEGGAGGDGGEIYVLDNLASNFINISGGDCSSIDESDIAGSAGGIYCESISVCSGAGAVIYMVGGNRDGATSVANFGNTTADGGTLEVLGSAQIDELIGWGGDVSTDFPNSSGGNGANVSIGGDFRITSMELRGGSCIGSSGGNGGTVSINGDMNSYYGIELNGGDSENGDYAMGYYTAGNGGNLTVNGNLHVMGTSYGFLSGGEGINSSGGNAGNLDVDGNVNCSGLSLWGGDSSDSGFTGNFSAGNGGTLIIKGSCNCANGIYTDGGDGNGSSGGNGGPITIKGDVIFTFELSTTGGNCLSSSFNTQRSGSGGNIHIWGSAYGFGSINTSGGNRTGTLSSSGSAAPPDAGYIIINGPAYLSQVTALGGNISTTSFAPSQAGNGGDVYFRSSVRIYDDITLNGGNSTSGDAGGAGSLEFINGISCNHLEMNGGSSLNGWGGGSSMNNWYSPGVAIFESISMNGGDGYEGGGGSAGFIIGNNNGDDGGAISIFLMVDSVINMNGGNCYSTDETAGAGLGGSIYVNSISGICDVYGNGGNRTGNTSATWSYPYFDKADGGRIIVLDGQANLRSVYLNGGSASPTDLMSTHYPTPGGEGGVIVVHGALTFKEIEISGGDSYGEIGGKAGLLNVYGFCSNHADVLDPITAIGGSSYAITTPAVAAQALGEGGTFNFYGGAALSKIESKDGLSGAATTAAMEISLYGHCSIGTLDVTNRADSKILGSDVKPTTLKVFNMPTKTTLNGPSTTSSSVSAYLTDSIFSYASGTWYRHTGTAL